MTLIKYDLDYEKTLEYIEFCLKNVNALSDEVLKTINFKSGSFFTLLHEKCNLDDIYDFKTYFILPSELSLRRIIRDRLSKVIVHAIERDPSLNCVFDDLLRDQDVDYESDVLNKAKYKNNEQVYLVVNEKNVAPELLLDCFHYSHAFWHSLSLLTTASLEVREGKLSEMTLHDIASHTQMIMLLAYDGDGYVLWQRSDQNYF